MPMVPDLLANIVDSAAAVFLDPTVWVVVLLAAVYGIFMGAIPGLTATMAVALLIPLTHFLDPVPAIAAVVSLVACAIFAGDIPTTLVRIPGTPSSAAYTDDAYQLTLRGRHRETLGVSLVQSVTGGLFGAIVLIFLARHLAQLAVEFTTYEYFWLYLLGLSCAAVVSRGSALAGGIALVIGLLVSTIGLPAVYSTPRFTFGVPELAGGIEFLPAMVGLFGVSEVLRNVTRPREELAATPVPAEVTRDTEPEVSAFGRILSPALQRAPRRWLHFLRSSGIGAVVGMLPGAGADIGAWVSKAVSKRFSKHPEEYGRGSLDAVADATSANNAAIAGAWIPALVFGIPGDSVTAIVIAVFYMKGVQPGPRIFENSAGLVESIYLLFILANLVLLVVGFFAIRASGLLVRVPRRILLPCVLLFCVLGCYAIHASTIDVCVMLVAGLVGWLLDSWRIPLGPVVLGIILGGPLEERFIQSLQKSGGSIGPFFGSSWAIALGSLTLLLWCAPWLRRLLGRPRPLRSPPPESTP